jgi:ATP-dependent RNA helicase RhlE
MMGVCDLEFPCRDENLMSFAELNLPASLLRNVQSLGFTKPTPVQAQAIPAARSGRDLVATAQTGTGKTAAFLLPVLEQLLAEPPQGAGVLILTPTRELAQQIQAVSRGLAAGTPLRTALVIGGVPEQAQVRALRSGAELVVATPGRMLALLDDGKVSLKAVRTLILDEADQMFDLGFFPAVKRIIGRLTARKQTLLFSATMPPEVAKLGRTILRDPVTVAIGVEGTAATGVTHAAYHVPTSRKAALLEHLLEQIDNPSVLVFTRTRHGARKLARSLYEAGHKVAELHGDRSPAQRERAMRGFRDRAYPVLVATNIAARGIDVRHITHVINFDVPMAPEEYVHRIGRTGRAGDQGDALVFVAPEESAQLARIERKLGKPIPRLRLADFDYSTPNATGRPKPRHRTANAPPRKKSYRGQGRR